MVLKMESGKRSSCPYRHWKSAKVNEEGGSGSSNNYVIVPDHLLTGHVIQHACWELLPSTRQLFEMSIDDAVNLHCIHGADPENEFGEGQLPFLSVFSPFPLPTLHLSPL